jgi:hypothetical protein
LHHPPEISSAFAARAEAPEDHWPVRIVVQSRVTVRSTRGG